MPSYQRIKDHSITAVQRTFNSHGSGSSPGDPTNMTMNDKQPIESYMTSNGYWLRVYETMYGFGLEIVRLGESKYFSAAFEEAPDDWKLFLESEASDLIEAYWL